jgi:dTDP-glucose pyrophosphorylase
MKRLVQAGADDIRVGVKTSVLECMKVIDRTGLATALLCDDDGKLLAVLTDGDVRRYLIDGGDINGPAWTAATKTFVSIGPDTDRATALQMMLSRRVPLLPVVDNDGKLQNITTLRRELTGGATESWAVVMAGGEGRRLGELTKGVPKPMLPVGGSPILEHIVEHLVSHGIRRIFLSVGYLGSMIEDYFGDGTRHFCRIEYLREKDKLGTGGALGLLPEKPTHPLIVMNGDLLTRINVTRLLSFHAQGEYTATMALRQHEVEVPFGVAELDGDRVLGLTEKPSLNYQINAGIYVVNPELLDKIPPNENFPITNLWQGCIEEGLPVGGYHMQESWNDIGLPEQYASAKMDRP